MVSPQVEVFVNWGIFHCGSDGQVTGKIKLTSIPETMTDRDVKSLLLRAGLALNFSARPGGYVLLNGTNWPDGLKQYFDSVMRYKDLLELKKARE